MSMDQGIAQIYVCIYVWTFYILGIQMSTHFENIKYLLLRWFALITEAFHMQAFNVVLLQNI